MPCIENSNDNKSPTYLHLIMCIHTVNLCTGKWEPTQKSNWKISSSHFDAQVIVLVKKYLAHDIEQKTRIPWRINSLSSSRHMGPKCSSKPLMIMGFCFIEYITDLCSCWKAESLLKQASNCSAQYSDLACLGYKKDFSTFGFFGFMGKYLI